MEPDPAAEEYDELVRRIFPDPEAEAKRHREFWEYTASMKAKSEEVPKEYEAFRNLLQQVVKPEAKPKPKPSSAPAPVDKG
jgi:hypothetical protein